MKHSTITIDTHALLFTAQVLLGVAVLASVAYAFMPIYTWLTFEDTVETYGGLEESGADTAHGQAIEKLLAQSEQGIGEAPTFKAVSSVYRHVPEQGKFVAVDEVQKEVTLYEDGARVAEYPILHTVAEGEPGALKEGEYTVHARHAMKVSMLAMVRFPYYLTFGEEYALHGVPTTTGGIPVEGEYKGGSVELSLADAEKVFAFVATNTPLHVRVRPESPYYAPYTSLVVVGGDTPATSAHSFVVSDLSRGQVVLEKNAGQRRPMASITKLFTAVVAGEIVGHGSEVRAPNGELYTLGDLFYPLLLRSDNAVAASIAATKGTRSFLSAMNRYVDSLGMPVTSFSDASGLSPQNVTTAYDLATFARHLYRDKRYILDISKQDAVTITSAGGSTWSMQNQNKLAGDPHFRGGKLGFTDEAQQTALSIFNVPIDGEVRTIAVVVLGSQDWKQDTRTLLRWLLENVEVEA